MTLFGIPEHVRDAADGETLTLGFAWGGSFSLATSRSRRIALRSVVLAWP